MRSIAVPRWRWPRGKTSRDLPYDAAEAALIVALAAAACVLFWTLVRPLGPLGNWQAKGNTLAAADPTILTRFDPFFRLAAASGPVAVTSLPLKLFGIRLDQAMGRGSAIIQTPDNIQSSFAVGDEIVPGVVLKSVAFDSVTIERGGAAEQLFLDQSVPAGAPASPGQAGAAPVATAIQSLTNAVNFAPRMVDGAVSGFTVSPKGTPEQFAATGLQNGDIVTQINGTAIRTLQDVQAIVAGDGGVNSVTVERGGRTVTVTTGLPK